MISITCDGPMHYSSNHLSNVKIRFLAAWRSLKEANPGSGAAGERGRFVWTDTWLRRNGRWQIVLTEDLVVAEPTTPVSQQ
jgi:hypothetical protein